MNSLDDAPYDVAVNDLDRNVSFQTTYEVKGSGNFDIDVKIVSKTLEGRPLDAIRPGFPRAVSREVGCEPRPETRKQTSG